MTHPLLAAAAHHHAHWLPQWFTDFAQTPGFAGVLAVIAAVIAYLASTRNARKERWWKRAEYALNLTLSKDESVQLAGLEMLDSLKSRDRREQSFISAATNWFLDPKADGDETDDYPEPEAPIEDASMKVFAGIRGFFSRHKR